MSNKVSIEVTPEGWSVKVNYKGKEHIEKWTKEGRSASCTNPCFDDKLPEGLSDAIDTFTLSDIANNID